jgi:hypothetical protein
MTSASETRKAAALPPGHSTNQRQRNSDHSHRRMKNSSRSHTSNHTSGNKEDNANKRSMVQKPINQTDEADFELLKLVERPNSKMNSPNLPKTLEDCEGYLTQLPLVPPNSDKKSSNIANMDNILTLTEAQDNFTRAAESMTDNEAAPGSGSLRVSLMRRRRLP